MNASKPMPAEVRFTAFALRGVLRDVLAGGNCAGFTTRGNAVAESAIRGLLVTARNAAGL